MTAAEDDLLRALEPLDRLLGRAVSAAQRAGEPDAIEDRFRGLYVGSDDVQELLGRGPGGLPRWSVNLGSSAAEAAVAASVPAIRVPKSSPTRRRIGRR